MNKDIELKLMRAQENIKLSLAKRMAEREHDIITRCVAAFKANKITGEQLFGAIATIAELRSIVTEVEHDQMAAQRAAENLTKE